MDYRLLDSGNQKKLEAFGPITLIRPCSAALWSPLLDSKEWDKADARFIREEGNQRWEGKLPSFWEVAHGGLRFQIAPTDFGHVGLFPEHAHLWQWGAQKIRERGPGSSVLNLFGYTGGASLAFAQAGAEVCHIDASFPMVRVAKQQSALNGLSEAPIRWIVDDVFKFLKREIKRGRLYDAILLDPPSFGRGTQGEVFKIEAHILPLLALCKELLSKAPLFLICSTHTPGMTPLGLGHIVTEVVGDLFGEENIEAAELAILPEKSARSSSRALPTGCYARAFVPKKMRG